MKYEYGFKYQVFTNPKSVLFNSKEEAFEYCRQQVKTTTQGELILLEECQQDIAYYPGCAVLLYTYGKREKFVLEVHEIKD